MQVVKFYSNEQVDLGDLTASQLLVLQNLSEFISKIMFNGNVTFNGLTVQSTAVASGAVEIIEGIILQNGSVIEIPATLKESVNVLSTNGSYWGTGVAANGSFPRYSIVCIKYATTDTTPTSKNFYDVVNDVQYTQTVNTRTEDYYDITVVHGTAATNPTVPDTPSGYIKLAEILIPAGATAVTSAMITDKRPATVQNIGTLNAAVSAHISNATGAHAASAISIVDTGGYYVASNAETALQEEAARNQTHRNASAPHSGHALTSRKITAGTGLTGGGDFTADRTIAIATGAVTDTLLGNRTVDQAISATAGNSGTLTQLLSWLTKQVKALAGSTNWYDTPTTSLNSLSQIAAALNSRTITAGSGLTGGGDLSADRTISIASSGVSDTHIGSRTVNDALAGGADSGTLTQLLSWVTKELRLITGNGDWFDAPTTNLTTLNARNISAGSGLTGGGSLAADRTIAIASGGVTDTHLGNRTIVDSAAVSTDTGALTTLLSAIGGRLKTIMGTSKWYDNPATTLAALNARTIYAGVGLTGGGSLAADRTISIASGGVTDTHLGNRTVNDATPFVGDTGTLTDLLSAIGRQLKLMKGTTNWYDSPSRTLADLNAHIGAGGGAHALVNSSTAGFMSPADKNRFDDLQPSVVTPNMDGSASPGSSPTYARGDHRHPTDTTRAPITSPSFGGTPTAPTPSTSDMSTRIATTDFVQRVASYGFFGATSGTNGANYYVSIAPSPVITNGLSLKIRFNMNNYGASYLLVNGNGWYPILKPDGSALRANNLKGGGVYTLVYYGGNFILQGEGGEKGFDELDLPHPPMTSLRSTQYGGAFINTNVGGAVMDSQGYIHALIGLVLHRYSRNGTLISTQNISLSPWSFTYVAADIRIYQDYLIIYSGGAIYKINAFNYGDWSRKIVTGSGATAAFDVKDGYIYMSIADNSQYGVKYRFSDLSQVSGWYGTYRTYGMAADPFLPVVWGYNANGQLFSYAESNAALTTYGNLQGFSTYRGFAAYNGYIFRGDAMFCPAISQTSPIWELNNYTFYNFGYSVYFNPAIFDPSDGNLITMAGLGGIRKYNRTNGAEIYAAPPVTWYRSSGSLYDKRISIAPDGSKIMVLGTSDAQAPYVLMLFHATL